MIHRARREAHVVARQFKTMEDSCRELVLTGVTTVEEARKTITALE